MKVNKAVIAAAGRGTRFLPITKAYPKEMLPILNKPVIQVLVEEIIGAGITEVAIVHQAENRAVPDYFSPDPTLISFLKKNNKLEWLESLELIKRRLKKMVFIPQSPYLRYGTGSPIIAARNFIGNDSFAYLYGDDLIGEKVRGLYLKTLVNTFVKDKVSALVGVDRVPWAEVKHYGTVRFDGPVLGGKLQRIEEKLSPDKAPSRYVVFGRFVLSAGIIHYIEALEPDGHEELMFIEALNFLAKEHTVTVNSIKKAKWLTVGNPLKWLEANLEFQKLIMP